MKDKDILKLKFGLATVSLILLLTGSKLLFDQWRSINFALTLKTFSAFVGLQFITFDFDKNKADGLFEDRDSNLTNMTVDIHSDNNQIEIKTLDRDEILFLKKEKFNDRV